MIVAFIIPCGADYRNEKIEPSKGKMPEKQKKRVPDPSQKPDETFFKKIAKHVANFT